jgi:hypothetical protein
MEYYGGRLCVSMHELVGNGIMSKPNYKQMARRGRFEVARQGKGAGNYALVVVETLPSRYLDEVKEKLGTGDEVLVAGWLRENYERDQAAVAWFNDRTKTGVDLKAAKKEECIVNASVLNTCIRLYERASTAKRLMGESYGWEKMATAIEGLREQFGHTLPTSVFRFRKKVAQYKREGYPCLLSGKFGNQSARRMTHLEEQVILGIACLENQPYNTTVREMYIMFLTGELEVYDINTGELFDPDNFAQKGEEPWIPSEATIANYLNRPKNKILIEKRQRSRTDFMHEQMPHMHRHNGEFSLSQVTMDDVDLPRRMKGNERVHAYYAYDVVSQCRIGAAYGRKKDERLVVDCFRDMFRLIERNGWGMPAGIEVEQHLMSQYKDGFLRAGVAFPFVHFCAPQNSQEKYAEPLNGAFKRSIAHKNHAGIGRFYGKGKNRVKSKKISDETNETYEDERYFTFEQLVADDLADNKEWNNTLHPNQKKYPGMTRWQVLEANINPTLQKFDKLTLSRYIGERVETSIRRNSTVRVCYEDWWLSSPGIIEQLEPNNYKVTAYFLPDENGAPQDVYIFQGDRYIDKVEKVQTYNRVMAEQTDEDVANYVEQRKKVAAWGKYINDNAALQVGVLKRTTKPEEPAEAVEMPFVAVTPEADEVADGRFAGMDWSRIGVQDS